jgi:Zn-dependent protease with chaperone function
MNTAFSLVVRAWLALLLMVGFYVLALGLAFGLLYIPYAEFVYGHRVSPKLFVACLGGALAILWAILPRWDSFEAPGPRLDPNQNHRLFAILESVAKATGQTLPGEVYLVPEVNAFVSSRGGVMGFFSRRIMGLGAPLMQALTVSEFKAVIAHEFGHYVGGDVGLGPWIYKTREAIVRTVQGLKAGSALQIPFLMYANLFFKVTLGISRHQEYQADKLAAQTIGAKPMIDGLRKSHGAGIAYGSYWKTEVAPVLGMRLHPPVLEGFKQFMLAESVSGAVAQDLEEHEKSGKSKTFDSHPSLKERIAALKGLPQFKVDAQDWPAIDLLTSPGMVERELTAFLVPGGEARPGPLLVGRKRA